MAWEYYTFIGVEQDAAQEEIKRACFRKRRQLAIDNDEKGLEYLNEVSQTLQDVRTRADYNALQQHGDEISRLYNEAIQAMETKRWRAGIDILQRILILAPEQSSVRNLLGICYTEAWMFADAQATF